MDDLISRQVAIENSFEVYTKEYGWCEVVGVDAILELPSAQPECEDTVSRADALRLIRNVCPEEATENGLLYQGVKQLPSVTPKQPGWIPTSERLPDNDRAVLVTLKWAEDDYEVAVGEYWHNSTASHGWGSFEGHVIAWHELPTPYREGGQE